MGSQLQQNQRKGEITKEEYVRKKDELNSKEIGYQEDLRRSAQYLEETASRAEAAEPSVDMAVFSREGGLTQELVTELVERIEVYDHDRIEIKWKVKEPSEK